MDSLWDNPNPDPRIRNIFKFHPDDTTSQQCECLSTHPLPVATPAATIHSWPVKACRTDAEWTAWLDSAANPALDVNSPDRAFAAIFVPRPPSRPDLTFQSNKHPRVLEYLPFTRTTFDKIQTKMLLHTRAMSLLLHRGVPVISRIPAKFHNIDCHVYILRLQHGLDSHHQELVVTHVPALLPPASSARGQKTYAMVLGTSEHDRTEYKRILGFYDQAGISSPFTIIKLFLELERERRWDEIDRKITLFQKKFFGLDEDKNKAAKPNAPARGFHAGSDPEGLVKLYIDISLLKVNLTSWSVQIEGFLKTITDDHPKNTTPDFKYMQAFLSMLVCEYQSKINKCETMLQGASLAFQMETVNLSRMDTNIALRDGKQMKAIALLTMIFLPATFIATLLAVPQFESIKAQGPGSYPAWTWYLILFLPLTLVVLVCYGLWIWCHKPKGLQDLSNV
ncbi:hypothetical protein V8F20_010857 [Naviculisporaceae sp. PSN 640]